MVFIIIVLAILIGVIVYMNYFYTKPEPSPPSPPAPPAPLPPPPLPPPPPPPDVLQRM
jgi:hypothetical protein